MTHAVKPPLPLGVLALGQSDLYPSHIRIDFNSIFPDAAYDPGNPHELKLGAFDLTFVLIYLAPLALIALTATRLTGEQDSGILRLIAAQPVAPRIVAAAKYIAIAIVSLVVIVGGAALSLAAQQSALVRSFARRRSHWPSAYGWCCGFRCPPGSHRAGAGP